MTRVKREQWCQLNAFFESASCQNPWACVSMQKKPDEAPKTDLICPVGIWQQSDGNTLVRSVFDSGATKSVTPADAFPKYPTQSSNGSREGRGFTTADGAEVPNKGEQFLPAVTAEGARTISLRMYRYLLAA